MATVVPGPKRKLQAAPSTRLPADETKPAPPLTREQQIERLAKETNGALARAFVQIRNRKRAFEKQAVDEQHKLDVLEIVILGRLKEDEQDGYSAGDVVVFKKTLTTARVTDGKELIDYILEDPKTRIELLNRAASIDGIRNHIDRLSTVDDETGEVTPGPLPPGTELNQIVKLSVRKK